MTVDGENQYSTENIWCDEFQLRGGNLCVVDGQRGRSLFVHYLCFCDSGHVLVTREGRSRPCKGFNLKKS